MPCVSGRRHQLAVIHAAASLAAAGNGCVTAESLEAFLDAYQQQICFSESELAVFVPSLKLALIERLSDACKKLKDVLTDRVSDTALAAEFERLISALRFLSGFDASEILENVNRIERTLRLDPSGVYPLMDEHTRYIYRHEIGKLAQKYGLNPHDTAQKALELSKEDEQHVGYYIFTRPLGRVKKARTGAVYISFVILASLFLALLISFALDNPAISVLLVLPISEIIKNITDYFILRLSAPQRVPRMELKDGVPDNGRTLCVVSVLLSSAKSGAAASRLLEEYKLSNTDAGDNLMFAILADLPDAPEETAAYDDAYLKSAVDEISRLNETYRDSFFLFCRGRRYNERDGHYTAWERKRGAILELCRF